MTDTRWERWAAATGIAFVVLAVAGFAFAYDLPKAGSTGQEIVAYFETNATAVKWQVLLFGLSVIFFLWFAGTIASAIRRAENDPAGRIPAIVVASAATAAAVYLGGAAGTLALARATGLEETTAALAYQAGTAAFVISDFVVAAFVLAIALGVIRTALLPAWISYAGAIFVVLALVDGVGAIITDSTAFGAGGVIGSITFLAFLAWIFATSALLLQRVTAEAPAPRMAPTG